MNLFLLLLAALLALPAQAQLRLPSLPQSALPGLPGLPGLPRADRLLPPPLPELVTSPLRELRALSVANLLSRHPDLIEADPAGEPIRRQELVLVSPTEATRAAALAQGFRMLREEDWPELGLSQWVLRPPPGVSTAEAVNRLRALDPQLQVDFNHLYTRSGQVTPGKLGTSVPPNTGPVRVGLVDSGVDRAHPALRRTAGPSFGCGGRAVPSDHGTAVASLLAGRERGFAGAAPQAQLFAADVYCDQPDGGSAEQVARALAWLARERVAVVNISLVGPPNRLMELAVQALSQRGHLVVAAVGNDGPAAPPLYPAAYPGVVGVTGVSPARRVLPEAAQGPQVMWAAPGSELAVARSGGGYGVARGTSFAAPLVAGLLAAELGVPDVAAAAAALDKLAGTARDLGAPGRDPVYGRGLVAEDLRVEPEQLQSRQR